MVYGINDQVKSEIIEQDFKKFSKDYRAFVGTSLN